jgi:adenylyltransferase/sulfurtransferase
VLGVVPGIVGTIQAAEALKVIAGIGEPLIGRLLSFDALEMRFQQFKLKRRVDCPVCGDAPTQTTLVDYDAFCGVTLPEVPSIEASALLPKLSSVTLVDVREVGEREIDDLANSLSIPLGQLGTRFGELPTDQDLVVFCRVGERSARAVEQLRRLGFHRAMNLAGGLEALRALE